MTAALPPTIHATTVAIGGFAVALRGASGAGKSDLALRLIDRGATLVADDRTILSVENGTLVATCPPSLAGLIEVRGIGIVAQPAVAQAPLALLVDLGTEERLPAQRSECIQGHAVPVITIDPTLSSAPIKVELALAQLTGAST